MCDGTWHYHSGDFDLQLHDMAMQLCKEHEDTRKQFLFHPDELHIALQASAAVGKYIGVEQIKHGWLLDCIPQQL